MAQFVTTKIMKLVEVWELGKGSVQESKFLKEEKFVYFGTLCEVHTKEFKEYGMPVKIGEFFTVDEEGYPVIHFREDFLKNHIHIKGNIWAEVIASSIAWEDTEGLTPEIKSIIEGTTDLENHE